MIITPKSTRKAVVSLVRDMVEYHIKDNAEVLGLSSTRSFTGVNLGEVVEIIVKSLFRNKLTKSAKAYDLQAQGEKVEVKFTTSDAYAHAINPNQKVDRYLIVAYSKGEGLLAFNVPASQKDEIILNTQRRVVVNQKAKFLDRELTKRLTPKQ